MEEFFTTNFWTTLYEKLMNWTIGELPSIFMLVIITIIALRLVKFSLGKIKKVFINRFHKQETSDSAESEKRVNTLIGITRGLFRIVILTIFFMILLSKLGVNIGPILASAGIIGLAVGFGAQELVRDFISGFFILLENQIREGDVAIINGTGGVVERIELRTTILRDFSGVVHIFQNGKISSMANMTKEWSAVVVEVGVAYKENADNVMSIMKDVAETLAKDEVFGPKINEPVEIFGIDAFKDSAVLFKARIKTKPIEQWSVGREYRKRLKAAFDEKNIEIPFPHTTVYWGQEVDPLQVNLNEQKN